MTTFTPTHAVIKTDTLSKWQLSRKLPGKFSLTVQRGHWLTRYVSQEAGFAIAEAWLHKLDSHAPDHWCLMDKHDHDHVFFMQVRSGVVREATTLKIDDINPVKLSLSERLYLTPALAEEERWQSWPCESVPPLEERDWRPYPLKPNKSAAFIIGGAFLIVCLALSVWLTSAPPKPGTPQPHVVDVYQDYRHAMTHAVSASEGFNDALLLTSISALAPSGWNLSKVTLQGSTMVAVIERGDDGLMSSAKHYLASLDSPATSVLTLDALTLTKPVKGHLDQWQDELAPYSLGFQLVDVLTGLGWHTSNSNESKLAPASTLDVTLNKNSVALSELPSLTTLFRPLPLSLQALTLTPNTDGTYRAVMRLQYIGE
ncbi:TPA: hypothetical protein ACN976_000769 [Vibrio campbellii]